MRKATVICCIVLSFCSVIVLAQTPDSWTRVTDYPAKAITDATSFSTDSFGYIILGEIDTIPIYSGLRTDLWQYNPYSNIWMQKTSFPAHSRVESAAFVIGSKAYVGLGNYDFASFSDFWEYDLTLNTWTQKNNFGGGDRGYTSVAFSMNGKGYVGMGFSDTANAYKKDMWEYDPSNDTWAQKHDFPGLGVSESFLFSLSGKAYFGFGYYPYGNHSFNDFWQWDPISDTWTQLNSFSGDSIAFISGKFAIGNKGYIDVNYDSANTSILGDNHFWEYNPVYDSWTLKDSFLGDMRYGNAYFSCGNKGFIGTGSPTNSLVCTKAFWMYTPDSISTGINGIDTESLQIYPNPATDKIYIGELPKNGILSICDMTGRTICRPSSGETIDVSSLPSAIYVILVKSGEGSKTIKFTKL